METIRGKKRRPACAMVDTYNTKYTWECVYYTEATNDLGTSATLNRR